MNRLMNAAWIRPTMLLCALGGGILVTRFVPSYQEMAAARERPAASSPRDARRHAPQGVTGVDVNRRHLALAACIS
jgi:hypothetical protein